MNLGVEVMELRFSVGDERRKIWASRTRGVDSFAR
jgi:hypothetical protein